MPPTPLLLTALMLTAGLDGAAAQVIRCAQPDGSVVLTDKRCPLPAGARPADPRPRAAAPGDDTAARNRREVISTLEAELEQKRAAVDADRAQQASHQARLDAEAERQRGRSTTTSAEAFDVCTAAVARVALQSVVAGHRMRVLTSTPDLQMTRICTSEGSVLVTCSRQDARRITTTSPPQRGDGCSR